MERIDTWQQDRDTASFTLALQTQCATIRLTVKVLNDQVEAQDKLQLQISYIVFGDRTWIV